MHYEELVGVVTAQLLKGTRSALPAVPALQENPLQLLDEAFARTVPIAPTRAALQSIGRWVRQNQGQIESGCFYGSVPARAYSAQSITIPKSDNEYVRDRIEVGPSDVDAVIITNEVISLPEPVRAKFTRVGIDGSPVQADVERDLCAGVTVIHRKFWKESVLFSEALFPMYFRMLCASGSWVKDQMGLRHEMEREAVRRFGQRELALTQARAFYRRRIEALADFLRQAALHRVEGGYLYGTPDPDQESC